MTLLNTTSEFRSVGTKLQSTIGKNKCPHRPHEYDGTTTMSSTHATPPPPTSTPSVPCPRQSEEVFPNLNDLPLNTLDDINVDKNRNGVKAPEIIHIDSDDDFVNDEKVRNPKQNPKKTRVVPGAAVGITEKVWLEAGVAH